MNDNFEYYLNQGVSYFNTGYKKLDIDHINQSITHLEKALKLDDNSDKANYYLGLAKSAASIIKLNELDKYIQTMQGPHQLFSKNLLDQVKSLTNESTEHFIRNIEFYA